jgi:hypothetical protein
VVSAGEAVSALAEALVAAQRRSLATLEKAYVAGAIDAEPMTEALERCGITDAVDRAFLIASLTGVDEERDRREERSLGGAESPREGTEA